MACEQTSDLRALEGYPVQSLVVDESFVPCPVEDGDEYFANGIFEFNVTRILESIERNPGKFALVHVAVNRIRWGDRSLDEMQVETADVARPVLLAEIAPGNYNLIDGHHRVEKAHRSGLETVQAFALTAAQHVRFLTSTRAYRAYVRYWNDKVKEQSEAVGDGAGGGAGGRRK